MLDREKIELLALGYKGFDFAETYRVLGIKYGKLSKVVNTNYYVDEEEIYIQIALSIIERIQVGDPIISELRAFMLAASKVSLTHWKELWQAGWQIESDHTFLKFFKENFERIWT